MDLLHWLLNQERSCHAPGSWELCSGSEMAEQDGLAEDKDVTPANASIQPQDSFHPQEARHPHTFGSFWQSSIVQIPSMHYFIKFSCKAKGKVLYPIFIKDVVMRLPWGYVYCVKWWRWSRTLHSDLGLGRGTLSQRKFTGRGWKWRQLLEAPGSEWRLVCMWGTGPTGWTKPTCR